jgi:hypothetical protein
MKTIKIITLISILGICTMFFETNTFSSSKSEVRKNSKKEVLNNRRNLVEMSSLKK